jgi:Flp pilus assembly pilin Flp
VLQYLAKFLNDEDGAVTVDWVVLTAAVVGLGMLVLYPIAFSTTSSTQLISDDIADISVGYGNY